MPSGSGGHADGDAGGGSFGASFGVAAMQRAAASGIATEGADASADGSARGAAFSAVTAGLSVVEVGAGSGGVRLQPALATSSSAPTSSRDGLITGDCYTKNGTASGLGGGSLNAVPMTH
jgi:hypothetical protein